MQQFQIEKGVPIPGAGRSAAKYPLAEMEVGDSFFTDVERDRIYTAVSYFGYRNNKKFSVRKVDGGFRVWRTA